MINLLAYTKKLSEKIAYYDALPKREFMVNPFAKPLNITIIWVDKEKDKD